MKGYWRVQTQVRTGRTVGTMGNSGIINDPEDFRPLGQPPKQQYLLDRLPIWILEKVLVVLQRSLRDR